VERKKRNQSNTRNSEEMKVDSEGGKRKEEGEFSGPGGGERRGR
jgi:hypothetical protein